MHGHREAIMDGVTLSIGSHNIHLHGRKTR
jgi:hypothetical protein